MNAIQALLIARILWGVMRILLASLHYRLLIVAFAALAVALVVLPDLATRLAHLLGVGRGVDMVMYVSILILGMVWVRLYSRLRNQEMLITLPARDAALRSMENCPAKAEVPHPPPTPTSVCN